MDKEKFIQAIIKKAKIQHENGYVLDISDNLIEGVDIDIFNEDLEQGSGNELNNKFKAIYSSSALAVNNFAIVKKHVSKFEFLNESGFYYAEFERKFPSGLAGTPPNLDFAIENNDTIIAFESKYLEILKKKKVEFNNSYNQKNLDYLDDYWFSLLKNYKEYYSYLDIAQLIKHSFGLLNYKRKKKKDVILVYIYWTPKNFDKYSEYSEHYRDLVDFSIRLIYSKDYKFVSMTYDQFWRYFDNNPIFKIHFDKMRKRYKVQTSLV